MTVCVAHATADSHQENCSVFAVLKPIATRSTTRSSTSQQGAYCHFSIDILFVYIEIHG